MSTLLERMKAQKAALDAKSGGGERPSKPKQGTTRYRILPTWRSDPHDDFYRAFAMHWIQVNGQGESPYLCEAKANDVVCPICDKLHEGINATHSDTKKDEIRQSLAAQRYLVNAIDIDADSKKVIILEIPGSVLNQMTSFIIQEAEEAMNAGDEERANLNLITDLQKGVDIRIERAGAALLTKYTMSPCLSGSKLVSKEVASQVHDLDAYVESRRGAVALTKCLESVAKVTGISYKAPLASAPRAAAVTHTPSTPPPALENVYDDAEFEDAPFDPTPKATPIAETVDDLEDMLGDLV